MHGRLKVKTTAEQQEAKRKEREKKLKLYNAATGRIDEKRSNQEYDKEALHLTGEILSQNSDYSSLWNYRKEIFTNFMENKEKDEVQGLFRNELDFLESCLRSNPKSYGTWQHRCWVMDHMPSPDWKHELFLCNKFLEYDERNFHCWDYRRFVVKRSKVTAEEEFEFTSSKISSNFSNYSSWHYRSKLLPIIHPDPQHPVGVKEDALLQEFELVQNAFFTDPNDQSAWFYHRWLLGRGEKKIGITCCQASRSLNRLLVTFTKPVVASEECIVLINEEKVQGTWKSTEEFLRYTPVWIYEFAPQFLESLDAVEVIVQLIKGQGERSCCLAKDQQESWNRDEIKAGTLFRYELGAATSDILSQELESCQQLHELEPDNKWTLLTIVSLMRALDPLKYEKETLDYMEVLKSVDPSRLNYYLDLRSKCLLENKIEQMGHEARTLNLSRLDLSTIYHHEELSLVTSLDLSHNQLTNSKTFHYLQNLKSLDLGHNQIDSLAGLENIPTLTHLTLNNNNLETLSELDALASCSNLQSLDLRENPVCKEDDFLQHMKKMLPKLTVLNGEDINN